MEINYSKLLKVIHDLEFDAQLGPLTELNLTIEGIKLKFENVSRGEQSQLFIVLSSSENVSDQIDKTVTYPVLHLTYLLPDLVELEAIKHIFPVVNRINVSTVLPGFGFDEKRRRVFYRYSFPLFHIQVNKDQLREVLDLVIEMINIYSDTFSQVSRGEIGYEELVERAQLDYLSEVKLYFDQISS